MGRTTLIFKKSLFYKFLSYFYTVEWHVLGRKQDLENLIALQYLKISSFIFE